MTTTTTTPLDALKRFWWVALAFAAVGALVGGIPAPESATDAVTRWQANHTILVTNSSNPGSVFGEPVAFSQLPLFAKTGEVPIWVAEQLEYNGSPAQLANQITVTPEQQTGALRIGTTQNSADRAVEVADAFADQLIRYIADRQDEVLQDRLFSTLERLRALETELQDVESNSLANPQDAVLLARLDALRLRYSVVFGQLNELQAYTGGQLFLTTLERAQPIAVTERGLGAPRSRLSRGLLGGIVGLALGVGMAVVLARSDRKVRTREQAEELVGVAAHAMIPHIDGYVATDLAVAPGRHDSLADSYRTLRSVLSFIDAGTERPDGRGLVTVVVSAGPGDGKSSVTANLASAFAEAGQHTLVVNSDFRRPTLSKRLGVEMSLFGLLSVDELVEAPAGRLVAPVPDRDLSMFDLSPLSQFNPGELARVTARRVERLTSKYDRVIIDSSPIGATAEVLEIVPLADHIIIVVNLGHTSAQSLRPTTETLRRVSTGEILLVTIGGDANEAGYYYYYHHSRSDAAQPRARGWRRRIFGRKKSATTDAVADRFTPTAPRSRGADPSAGESTDFDFDIDRIDPVETPHAVDGTGPGEPVGLNQRKDLSIGEPIVETRPSELDQSEM